MTLDPQKLYELLPAIYRLRDAEQGEPLKALLAVIAEQIAVLQEDLAQLYDDQFIETCAGWVIPYIGDLIGYRQLYGLTAQVRSPRAEVANTIGLRRRKGTALMLEQLARDVTGWDARIVEFFQRLATTQYLNHVRPDSPATPDLRDTAALEHIHGPFDPLTYTVEVRRIGSGRGRYNLPNLGLFLWRLRGYTLTGSPAFKLDDQRYLFNPLGSDTPLFNRHQTGPELTQLATRVNVPMPISRRVLAAHLEDYYGAAASLAVEGIESAQVVVCNLADTATGWAHTPPAGKVAIDPALGRIALAEPPDQPPRVSFCYGFSADLGGGEYDRGATLDPTLAPVAQVPAPHATVQAALDAVSQGGAVEILDSGRYEETPAIHVAAGNGRIELRAANRARPLLLLGNELLIDGEEGAEVTLNGLLIGSGGLRLAAGGAAALHRLKLQHCTLVPGLSLARDGAPQQPQAPSLVIESADTVVEIDHAILGGLRVAAGARVTIANSIVDATVESGVAYAALDGISAGAPLTLVNCTVIGKVHTTLLESASNVIFLASLAQGDGWVAPVWSERRQQGCVRFSYVPPGSRVPRCYRCEPTAATGNVRPLFTSLRYGAAGYCQLNQRCTPEIRQGADDEAEMGAFHDLYQPQRETNLRVRLEEYLRFGSEAGILYAS